MDFLDEGRAKAIPLFCRRVAAMYITEHDKTLFTACPAAQSMLLIKCFTVISQRAYEASWLAQNQPCRSAYSRQLAASDVMPFKVLVL